MPKMGKMMAVPPAVSVAPDLPKMPRAETSQKMANPPHSRLKGIMKVSEARSSTPCFGRPAHSSFSPGSSSRLMMSSGCTPQ